MLSQSIWWGSIALEVLLLIRGFREKLVFRYPVFYAYVAFVLLQSLLRRVVYQWHSQLYPLVYWSTEFVGVVLGCGIVFEIYRCGLRAFPGTARMARGALGFVFAIACLKVVVDGSSGSTQWQMAGVWELERNLRTVQSLAIVALVLLFLLYSIRFGRNLAGILLGYSLFVGVSIFQLTFVSPRGTSFSDFWSYLHPISYDIALAIWLAHLWSYRPSAEPAAGVRLEQEYQNIAAITRRRLQEARATLRKGVRS